MLQRLTSPHTVDDHDDGQDVFSFGELSDTAKDYARQEEREAAVDHNWWLDTYHDAATVARLMGIEINTKPVRLMGGRDRHDPAILFSGFWSQGDGACFEGYWEPKINSARDVANHAPTDTKLHEIAASFDELAARFKHRDVRATVSHSGHYYHEYCTSIDIEFRDVDNDESSLATLVKEALDRASAVDTYEADVAEALRSFMRWIYGQLEAEYEHLTSDEAIDETLAEKEFDEDGNII